MKNVENIKFGNKFFGIIIRNDYSKDGVEFFTQNNSPQQIAYMKHPKGKKIDAHYHNIVKREISKTQEVLVIRKGSLRVDFYDDNQAYLESYILKQGDIIFLADGSHGFECLEDVEMIEIKQGPYLGELDKIRFKGVNQNEVKIR